MDEFQIKNHTKLQWKQLVKNSVRKLAFSELWKKTCQKATQQMSSLKTLG